MRLVIYVLYVILMLLAAIWIVLIFDINEATHQLIRLIDYFEEFFTVQ